MFRGATLGSRPPSSQHPVGALLAGSRRALRSARYSRLPTEEETVGGSRPVSCNPTGVACFAGGLGSVVIVTALVSWPLFYPHHQQKRYIVKEMFIFHFELQNEINYKVTNLFVKAISINYSSIIIFSIYNL